MLFSDHELRELVQGRPIGDDWPYCGGTEDDIERYLRVKVANIKASKRFEVDADFTHYGSGYASYVHVYCEKSGGKSSTSRGDCDWIDGIAIYLSRLAKYAVYGYEQRTRHATGGGSGSFIDVKNLYSLPPGDWQMELAMIRDSLTQSGFIFPERDDLLERLPFKLHIPTVFDNEDVFDALFYWED